MRDRVALFHDQDLYPAGVALRLPGSGARRTTSSCFPGRRGARIDADEVGDVVMGAAMQQGSQGFNVARQSALHAGLPTSVAGMSMDRQCASGLMAIATAAKEIMVDGLDVAVGGGLESISLVQNELRTTSAPATPRSWSGSPLST